MNNSVFGNHDDSVSDNIIVLSFFDHVFCIDKFDLVSDTGVFIDDGIADLAVAAYSYPGDVIVQVFLYFFFGFEEVGPHYYRTFQDRVFADTRTDPDDGMIDLRTVDNASLTKYGIMDIRGKDF